MTVWRCHACRDGKPCQFPEPCLPEALEQSEEYIRGYEAGLRVLASVMADQWGGALAEEVQQAASRLAQRGPL